MNDIVVPTTMIKIISKKMSVTSGLISPNGRLSTGHY